MQDTVHILRSSIKFYDSDMVDNYASTVSHGFTMVESDVFLEKTRISNSKSMIAKLLKLRLAAVDTGFFNMYLSSQLFISNESEIRGLIAQKNAMLSAISQSSLYVSKNVRFIDNQSFNKEGYTLQLLNTNVVNIESASFSGNHQINVNIYQAQLTIKNSTFTDAKRNMI